MPGREKGRPTKWVKATVGEPVWLGRSGITFEVWEKWKKKRKKLGTLIVSVGGVRWWPHQAKAYRCRSRAEVAELLAD